MNEMVLGVMILLTLLVGISLVLIFMQQKSLIVLQQQIGHAQDVFTKETQTIKTTQIMQTNHFQEDLHHHMTSQLAPLHQSLLSVSAMVGELQQLHGHVASLKQVLTKEKSKGLLGEVALEAMLASLLPSHMVTMQASHEAFGNNKVDALITLKTSLDTLFVPIDAKVMLTDYEAYAKNATAPHWNAFVKAIKTQAKSIKAKYIRPPYTTDFALMYIPFESLVHDLYQDQHLLHTIYLETKVYIVSPMTLHAFLNVILMSYKHHNLLAQSQPVIEHMSELLHHLDVSCEALTTMQKKHQEMGVSISTTLAHCERMKHHLIALEVSKKSYNEN